MTELATHLKLIADPSALGLRLFADWYRFGESQGPVPVVHYIGGAISSVDHGQRLESEPEAVLSVFRVAQDGDDDGAAV
jgi:hypothetical protein